MQLTFPVDIRWFSLAYAYRIVTFLAGLFAHVIVDGCERLDETSTLPALALASAESRSVNA